MGDQIGEGGRNIHEIEKQRKRLEVENTRKNHQRAIDSMQASLEAEAKGKAEALRMKKKLEHFWNKPTALAARPRPNWPRPTNNSTTCPPRLPHPVLPRGSWNPSCKLCTPTWMRCSTKPRTAKRRPRRPWSTLPVWLMSCELSRNTPSLRRRCARPLNSKSRTCKCDWMNLRE